MTHQEWTLQMADLPESIANARVCAAKLLGLSMLPAKSDEPAFLSAVIDVSGMAAPLEVEPGSFALLAAAVTAQHGAFVVLSRASVMRPWSYVGLFTEEAALQVAQRLGADEHLDPKDAFERRANAVLDATMARAKRALGLPPR